MNPAILRQLIAQMTPEQLAALGLRRPATDAEAASYDQAHAPGGAPADFAGPVFSNPDNARVSEDTESGGEPTRLPIGVNFQKQNFSGPMPLDRSNPLPAELGGIHASTVQANFAPKLPAGAVLEQSADSAPKLPPGAVLENAGEKKAEPGFLDRELPVDKDGPELVQIAPGVMIPLYKNATLSGLQSVGRGVRDAVTGMRDLFKAPQDKTETALSTAVPGSLPIYRMLTGLGHTAKDSLQAVAAIRDINAAPDPVSEYGKMLQEMAGQGAGQALTALATEGFVKGIPKVAEAGSKALDAAADKIRNVTPKQAAQATGGTAGAISGHGTLSAPGAYYGAKTAGKLAEKVLGVDRANAPIFGPKALEAPPADVLNTPLDARFPERPAPEVLQARALQEGGKPAVDRSAGLGKLPVRTPAEAASAADELEGVTSPQTEQAAASEPEASTGNAQEPVQAPAAAEETKPGRIAGAGVPRTLSGESALTQILTGQDNPNLIKIARSRGINVTQEAQLKPGVADTRLIKKIIDDHTPEELGEIRDTYLEHTRFRHNFGDIGPEAWKALSIQTYFPDVKLPAAVLKRTQSAIEAAGKPPAEVMNAPASEPAAPANPRINPEAFARTQEAQTKLGYPLLELLKDHPDWAKGWLNYEGQPTLKVYRGVDKPGTPISRGNYVTTSREAAQQYGPHIEEMDIPAKHLRYVRGAETGEPHLLDVGGKPELIYAPPKPRASVAEPRIKTPAIAKDDLTEKLAQSVAQAKGIKGGVFTSADPKMLAERWGVDESSIADTDANVRGKSAAESAAYIDKLAKAYKKGQAIEPVLETRDAQNNLISVDGRHRALAAAKAGIDRIPIIVRRAGIAKAAD